MIKQRRYFLFGIHQGTKKERKKDNIDGYYYIQRFIGCVFWSRISGVFSWIQIHLPLCAGFFLSPQAPCLIFNLETDKTISTRSVTLYFSTSCIERRETHYERNLAERRVFTDTMPLERVTFERKEHEHKIGRRLETASGCVEALFFISI